MSIDCKMTGNAPHPPVLLLSVGFAFALMATAGWAQAQPRPGEGAGPLLYETQCQNCHSAQVHWRDRKQAIDYPSLLGQVRRWQANLGLQWTDEQIGQVARYLNRRYYKFKIPARAFNAPVAPKLAAMPAAAN